VANLFLLIRLWLGTNWPAIIGQSFLHCRTRFGSIRQLRRSIRWAGCFNYRIAAAFTVCQDESKELSLFARLDERLCDGEPCMGSIALACYMVFVCWLLIKKRIRWCDVAAAAGLWVLGALPYEYLIIKDMVYSGDIVGTLVSAFLGQSWGGAVLNTHITGRMVKEILCFLALTIPRRISCCFLSACIRLIVLPQTRRLPRCFGGIDLVFCLCGQYTVPDRYAFLCRFIVLCRFLWAGFEYLCRKYNRTYLGIMAFVLA